MYKYIRIYRAIISNVETYIYRNICVLVKIITLPLCGNISIYNDTISYPGRDLTLILYVNTYGINVAIIYM